jgi:hypothetical protein
MKYEVTGTSGGHQVGNPQQKLQIQVQVQVQV